MRKIVHKLLGVFMILLGIGMFFYPAIATWHMKLHTKAYMADFAKTYPGEKLQDIAQSTVVDPLYEKAKNYNEQLFLTEQDDFKDPWNCEKIPRELETFSEECFGYISIPAMDVQLPLYIGASQEHMTKGAAILGQTSLPIGGENTNSVIAGHRGYRGVPFFRDIEKLEIGDTVEITNPWETLVYRVGRIEVIGAYDSHKVKIQEGCDMVTLLTCHPYRSHGKQRYVAYCVRDTWQSLEEIDRKAATHTAQQPYNSSKQDIQTEAICRYISGIAILCMCLVTFLTK